MEHLAPCTSHSSEKTPTNDIGRGLALGSTVFVALPLFGNEVSPRFCHAREALIIEWNGQQAIPINYLSLESLAYPFRLERLKQYGVEWLVCGSFPRERLPDATRFGIRISCGAVGIIPLSPIDLSNFLSQQLNAPRFEQNTTPTTVPGRSSE